MSARTRNLGAISSRRPATAAPLPLLVGPEPLGTCTTSWPRLARGVQRLRPVVTPSSRQYRPIAVQKADDDPRRILGGQFRVWRNASMTLDGSRVVSSVCPEVQG